MKEDQITALDHQVRNNSAARMSALFGTLLLQLACVLIVSGDTINSSSAPFQQISVITRVITIPSGYVHYPNVRAAYKVHDREVSWSHAKKTCIAEGARLAVIDTEEKVRLIKSQKPKDKAVWIGISKKSSHWVIANTEVHLSNLPWAPGQPEGVGDCVAMKKGSGLLYNRLCMWDQRFVCEIPIETTLYQMPCAGN